MEIVLDDGTSYIAFRGTDDTIVGWKEDFRLSTGLVPAQMAAVEYLNRITAANQRPLRVGGHSKGGNLAVYAAALCRPEIQERILEVYDNDGPGFQEEFLAEPGLEAVRSRIHRIIPEGSVIGMLFHHAAGPRVIESSQHGILQHDGFSWEVMGKSFLEKESISRRAAAFHEVFESGIEKLDTAERTAVINDFFRVLEATQVQTLTELQKGGIKNIKIILKKLEEIEPETRGTVEAFIVSLSKKWFAELWNREEQEELTVSMDEK